VEGHEKGRDERDGEREIREREGRTGEGGKGKNGSGPDQLWEETHAPGVYVCVSMASFSPLHRIGRFLA